MTIELPTAKTVSAASQYKGELHIWPQEPRRKGRSIVHSARLELTGRQTQELWYEFPIEYSGWLRDSADAYLVACILMAMESGTTIRVHGRVSPSLLGNLVEFQQAWNCWCPTVYHPVEIVADEEAELEPVSGDEAICPFTGGVDSAYTVYTNWKNRGKHGAHNIGACLFVHGFDIPLDQTEAFERAAERARSTLASLDIELITMSSNHKYLIRDWFHAHGVGIASCLMFFAGRFNEGIIANSYSYMNLYFPCGSNVISDRLLSSKSFSIHHDGAGCLRSSKVPVIHEWKEGFENLRVCYEAEQKDENCCRCSKCVITIVNMWRLGIEPPPSFAHRLTDQDILSLRGMPKDELDALAGTVRRCREFGFADKSWFKALSRAIEFNKRKLQIEKLPTSFARTAALALNELFGP